MKKTPIRDYILMSPVIAPYPCCVTQFFLTPKTFKKLQKKIDKKSSTYTIEKTVVIKIYKKKLLTAFDLVYNIINNKDY